MAPDTAPIPAAARPAIGLVLTGGGARAAYQVGVLHALAGLLPSGAPSPFPIICGTSAGAINAAALACGANDFRRTVHELAQVWRGFRTHQVYRSDALGVMRTGVRWVSALLLGGLGRHNPTSLLDNAPLGRLLAERLYFPGIQRGIQGGHLHALSITASAYASGESVSFCQGAPGLRGWRRARRVGLFTTLGVEHLLASSALPFIFPAVRIHREYFGDGSMRQIAPLSPALHLGAQRLLVIGTGRAWGQPAERVRAAGYPSLAQIAGHALNSIFLDQLETDLERLQRINRTIALVPSHVLRESGLELKPVEVFTLLPSAALESIAARHTKDLPRPIRTLFRGIGAVGSSGSTLASYLLFERRYCRAVMRLGYADAMERKQDLLDFLGVQRESEEVPVTLDESVQD
ncbi:MAG TPA: patatin-like phospholipase family protein [Burkholderiales bacterium]|nr:patatin-like phospholipase family protein [Burkholderiales bacterium]